MGWPGWLGWAVLAWAGLGRLAGLASLGWSGMILAGGMAAGKHMIGLYRIGVFLGEGMRREHFALVIPACRRPCPLTHC